MDNRPNEASRGVGICPYGTPPELLNKQEITQHTDVLFSELPAPQSTMAISNLWEIRD